MVRRKNESIQNICSIYVKNKNPIENPISTQFSTMHKFPKSIDSRPFQNIFKTKIGKKNRDNLLLF